MSKAVKQRKARNQVATSRGSAGEPRLTGRSKSISKHEIARYLKSAPRIDARRFRKDLDSALDQTVK